MNENLLKIDKIYRYDFSDDELFSWCDCIVLSESTEFYTDCIIFPATATLVHEIEAKGRIVEYPDSFKSSKNIKSRKARLRIELADPVPIKLIRRGEITAGELLHRPWKRYEVVKRSRHAVKSFSRRVKKKKLESVNRGVKIYDRI